MRVCRSRTKLVRHVGVALIRCLLTDHCWFVVPGARMRKTVVVFYVGGVTYLEVAAYRHLSEKRTYSALSQSGSCGPERFVVSYSAHRLHHRHYQGCEWLDLAPVTDQPNRQPPHVRASCTNICCVSDQCRCQPWRCEWQWARRWPRRRVACQQEPKCALNYSNCHKICHYVKIVAIPHGSDVTQRCRFKVEHAACTSFLWLTNPKNRRVWPYLVPRWRRSRRRDHRSGTRTPWLQRV